MNVVILSSLIVLLALFLSIYIKKHIKEELGAIKPYCALINTIIMAILIAFLIINVKPYYLVIFLAIGFIIQHFIKKRFFGIPFSLIATSFLSGNYLFSYASLFSLYYLLFGYSNKLSKKDLALALFFHLALLVLVFLGRYEGIIIALAAGLLINILVQDINALRKEKWGSI